MSSELGIVSHFARKAYATVDFSALVIQIINQSEIKHKKIPNFLTTKIRDFFMLNLRLILLRFKAFLRHTFGPKSAQHYRLHFPK
jgi:hypothetical protein